MLCLITLLLRTDILNANVNLNEFHHGHTSKYIVSTVLFFTQLSNSSSYFGYVACLF